MANILGLDLGTNSIGWAVVDLQDQQKPIQAKGVHIFSEGVKIEKGIESSKAAERTGFRSARRIKYRRRIRKQNTLKVLIQNGMCPLPMQDLNAWVKNKKLYPKNPDFLNWLTTDEAAEKNPYYFRNKASLEKIGQYDLGRAIYHIAQRRGFLSNRLDQGADGIIEQVRSEMIRTVENESKYEELIPQLELTVSNYNEEEDKAVKKLIKSVNKIISVCKTKTLDELKTALLKHLNKKENLGTVKKGIADVSQKILDAGCSTLGQYFYKLYLEKQKIRTHYTSREEHYLHEFRIICEVQQLSPEIISDLERAIFFQRPLKSQKGLIGKCSFEKTKLRCSVSHPAYEEYRALQFINSIKVGELKEGKKDFLNEEQRKQIWKKFIRKSKPVFDFGEIAKELTPKGTVRYFNYKDNVSVSGCPTIAQLVNIFGENWKETIYSNYSNKETKAGLKSLDEVINDVWHILFARNQFIDDKKTDKAIIEFAINKLKLDPQQLRKFNAIVLKKDYASLSLNAINKILPFLREGLIYSYAVFLANMPAVVGKEVWNNSENQKTIKKELKLLIDHYKEIKIQEGIINDLVSAFKKEYDNSHKDYKLDDADKRQVEKKVIAVYGAIYLSKLNSSEKEEIIKGIENKFEEQLRKYRGQFIKPKRLDEKIADFLIANFNTSEEQLKKLYHPSDIERFKKPERSEDGKLYLGSPLVPSIKNPMAMRTMHQLRKLINTLIKEGVIGEETKVHVELARELNDANKRKAIQDWQKERQQLREEYKNEIIKLYKAECGKNIEPSEDEILKFELWKEQETKCIYTGDSIGITDFIGANPKYDIEHTIPKSLSYDNSQKNLTLCQSKYNREVKGNKIPFDCPNYSEILPRLEKWISKVDQFDKLYQSRTRPRGIESKEQKDKRIREKHFFKLNLDYWKAKLNRFIRSDVPEGFKNSQLVDTGIITKYSLEYLKSVFPKVYAVKGEAVSTFRKLWGLQEEYSKKERVNHIHHCIDAITIACMTKDKYDMLAKFYQADEENKQNETKNILQQLKPWSDFTQDVKAIQLEVHISHHTPDNMKKQTRKKLRIRGKVQLNSKGEIIYQKGDTVRGSLHKETFYGAIIKPNQKEDVNPRYVLRKTISSLSAGDIKNIVDDEIRNLIAEIVKKDGIAALKGEIWQNKEKGIRLNKVRCYVPTVASPIYLKEHRDKSRFEHKKNYHVTNDGNYIMAIYEGKDKKEKVVWDFSIVNMVDAGEQLKLSNRNLSALIEPTKITGKGKDKIVIPLKAVIRKGTMVLFYNENPEEIWELNDEERAKRLYKVQKFRDLPWITLRYHQEARGDKEIKDEINAQNTFGSPQLAMGLGKFKVLVENYNFSISPSGKIEKI